MTSLVLQIKLLLRRPGAEGAVQSPIVRHGASLARDREDTHGLYMNHVFFPIKVEWPELQFFFFQPFSSSVGDDDLKFTKK
jgi:hypothetical protein